MYPYFIQMYGLYDKEGILRFIDSDKDACIAYAELFELNSTNYCLMDLANDTKKINFTNLDQSLEGSNN
jgi:hypothetical protein